MITLGVTLSPKDSFAPSAYPQDSGVLVCIRSVDEGWVVEADSPVTFRRLAAALTQAADLADKLATRAA